MTALFTATDTMSQGPLHTPETLEGQGGLLADHLDQAARLSAAASEAVARAEERARAGHAGARALAARAAALTPASATMGAGVAAEMQSLAADTLKAADELANGSKSARLAAESGQAAFAVAEGLLAGLGQEVAAADDAVQAQVAELARLAEDAEAGADAGRALCATLAAAAEPVQTLKARTADLSGPANAVAAAAGEAARTPRGC